MRRGVTPRGTSLLVQCWFPAAFPMTTTHKRKLRTDGTLWQHMRAPRVPHRALARDTSAEVLIVGAGITGAMIADALADAGLDMIVVDRRRPTQGSTVASTALVA